MFIQYIPKRFSTKSLIIIEHANTIISEYMDQGFGLTLRQLYYQFVARGLIPNKQAEYKKLGTVVNDARLAGMIPWKAIEDRTRYLRKLPSWNDPSDIISSAAYSYHLNRWENQDHYLEVWIEKDALLSPFEVACNNFDVPLFSCRGYSSQSETWRAGQRMLHHIEKGKTCIVLHFGDHDPSGMDMSRDIQDRLDLFTFEEGLSFVQVKRIALNYDQVEAHDPPLPPNPAKLTDTRATDYISQYGSTSWELDALSPTDLSSLTEKHIKEYIDWDLWDEVISKEEEEQKLLKKCSKHWEDIADYINETFPDSD